MHAMEEKIWLVNGNGIGKVLLVLSTELTRRKIDESFKGDTPRSVPSRGCHHFITCGEPFLIFEEMVCNSMQRILYSCFDC